MTNTVRVIELGTYPIQEQVYTCSPKDAVISAYAQSLNDWNTWQYSERYNHLVMETDNIVSCGDFTALKDTL